ncbi:MAG: hypothetical protein UHI81_07970 [Olegusella sp.]|nr:hypothetical protein [Olegusella sp.]
MSLRDTLAGAREEVAQSGNPFERTNKNAAQADADAAADGAASAAGSGANGASTGFSRRSVSRAKPKREAAGSVRYVSAEDARNGETGKSESEMTKQERKEKRMRERDAADRRADASRAILAGHDSYKRSQRIWWILLGVGMGFTVLSFIVSAIFGKDKESAQSVTVLMVVLLVIAYASIIGGFIYDWRVVRPMRQAADAEVASMSDKRVRQFLAAQEEEREAQARAKEKAGAGHKPSARHEQHK